MSGDSVLLKFDGKNVAIQGVGSNNPAVTQFVMASLALEQFGGLSHAKEAAAQIVGTSQDRGSDIHIA